MGMICPGCGNSCSDDAIFCTKCGCRLESEHTGQGPEKDRSAPQAATSDGSRRRRYIILVSALVLLLIAASILILSIRLKHGRNIENYAASAGASSEAYSSVTFDSSDSEGVSSSDETSLPAEDPSDILLAYASEACSESTYYGGSSVDCMFGYMPDTGTDSSDYINLNINPDEVLCLNHYDGILTYAAEDYDNDGDDELLIVRIKPSDYAEQTVTYEMYEAENGIAVLKSYYTDDLLSLSDAPDDYTAAFYIKKFDDRTVIYYENTESVSLVGDGISWDFDAVRYSDDEFSKVDGNCTAGSDIYYENGDFDEYISAFTNAGISNPGWRPFSSDSLLCQVIQGDPDAVCIGSVKKEAFADAYSIAKHFHPSEGDTVKYASTAFTGIENSSGSLSGVASAGDFGASASDQTDVQNNQDYILPDSSSEYLSENDLAALSPDELRLARNEIYARHGRIFNDESLQSYFSSKDWYYPRIKAEDFTESMLNEYEAANTKLITEYEKKH